MITYYNNYLYAFETDTIDNTALMERCLEVEQYLTDIFPPVEKSWFGNAVSAHNMNYNLLTFPIKELSDVYHLVQRTVIPLLEPETTYVIKSWMNVYRNGEYVDWHKHWRPESRVWHGFYCVNVGDSATYYKIPGSKQVITVPSKEGLIVVGKSEDDEHRSSMWNDETNPRITLAFDIVPAESINNRLRFGHYIPFKS
jgi:hypothetical protein